MKRLEELNISPAPWECVKAINAECGRSLIVRSCKGGELPTLLPQNARLIAAAPKLYECLREAVIEMCHNYDCCLQAPAYQCQGHAKECFVRKWRAALAEAAGEEVDDGER